ncbi:MAG: Smr/MutS family protein [Gemmatimonadaceae bacterium]
MARGRGRATPATAAYRALDEARYGDAGTLNLREGLPSGTEAAARAEAWLRQKQVEGVREVLIVTGRGLHSVGEIPVVRGEVRKRLTRLQRSGVVAAVADHTAGSYAVTLAPLSAMLDAPARSLPARAREDTSPMLTLFATETRQVLRDLAMRSLDALGVRVATRGIIADEMERQVALLVRSMPQGSDPDSWVRDAARRALLETD